MKTRHCPNCHAKMTSFACTQCVIHKSYFYFMIALFLLILGFYFFPSSEQKNSYQEIRAKDQQVGAYLTIIHIKCNHKKMSRSNCRKYIKKHYSTIHTFYNYHQRSRIRHKSQKSKTRAYIASKNRPDLKSSCKFAKRNLNRVSSKVFEYLH